MKIRDLDLWKFRTENGSFLSNDVSSLKRGIRSFLNDDRKQGSFPVMLDFYWFCPSKGEYLEIDAPKNLTRLEIDLDVVLLIVEPFASRFPIYASLEVAPPECAGQDRVIWQYLRTQAIQDLFLIL